MIQTAEAMLNFVRGKTSQAFAASPLFTSVLLQKLHAHDWVLSSTDKQTIDGICDLGQDCGFIPFFESLWFDLGVIDYDEIRVEEKGDVRDLIKIFRTPHGEFALIDRFHRHQSRHVAQTPFCSLDDLRSYEYVIQRSLDKIETIRPNIKAVIQYTGERGIPYFTVPNPLKCFSLVRDTDRIYLSIDEPERLDTLCKLNHKLGMAAIRIARDAGFEVTFATTESSIFSPRLLERFSHGYLEERRQAVRELGMIFYLHECGAMQKNVDCGFYERLNPDILEGFQAPPSGNITDLVTTVRQLPKSIITKGNLDLNFLLDSTPERVRDESLKILAGLKGRRHIMSGSCSALPGTPLANIRAMTEAVAIANNEKQA